LISVLSIVGGYVALICVAGLVGRHGSGAARRRHVCRGR
jgi:hypothetical protein